MAKQGVVPDALTQPFWDAANEGRLVIQHCHACNRLQHPPAPTCQQCSSKDHLGWQEMSGRGTIYNYGVVYDGAGRLLQQDERWGVAVIGLDEDPGIQMYSHLPERRWMRSRGSSCRSGLRGDGQWPKVPSGRSSASPSASQTATRAEKGAHNDSPASSRFPVSHHGGIGVVGTSRQGRGRRCRTLANGPALGRHTRDLCGRLEHPGTPESDGRRRRVARPD